MDRPRPSKQNPTTPASDAVAFVAPTLREIENAKPGDVVGKGLFRIPMERSDSWIPIPLRNAPLPVPPMDRYQPSTQNPTTPAPENLARNLHDAGAVPGDREPVVSGDDAQLPSPGVDKPQVSLDDAAVRKAEAEGKGFASTPPAK